jgi:hypothetical protein
VPKKNGKKRVFVYITKISMVLQRKIDFLFILL